jgi:hypothetical protein
MPARGSGQGRNAPEPARGTGRFDETGGTQTWQALTEFMRWVQVRSGCCLPMQRRLETIAEARRFPAMVVI